LSAGIHFLNAGEGGLPQAGTRPPQIIERVLLIQERGVLLMQEMDVHLMQERFFSRMLNPVFLVQERGRGGKQKVQLHKVWA